MKQTIAINNMLVHAHHGVMDQERRVGNDFEVTLRLNYPFDLSSDSIGSTLNYAEMTELIKEQMARPSDTLEHVASRIMLAARSRWPQVSGGMVRVAKLTPPLTAQLASASITIEWP